MCRETASKRKTRCLVFEGLGNRINNMVSGLLTGQEVELTWAVNKHCPVKFEQLFHQIDGIRVRNVDAELFPYQRSLSRVCWFYLTNVAKLDRQTFRTEAKRHYRNILDHLIHRPDFKLQTGAAGIHFRAHIGTDSIDALGPFLAHMKDWLSRKNPSVVFVASDSLLAKQRIQVAIARLGYSPKLLNGRLLRHDFDRSLENISCVSKEMICFSQCSNGVLSNSARSTVCDSARGFDVVIERSFDSRSDRRDAELEEWVNDPT